MRILVTGAAGFIGSHLVETLVSQGHQVTAFDNLSTGKREHLAAVDGAPGFRYLHGDICSPGIADELVANQEFVYHLCDNSDIRSAAEHPSDYVHQNVVAGVRLLDAMARHGVKKIVFPSSTTVIGDATQVPTPESYGPLKPMNLYGGAKLAMEGMISAYAYTYDLQAWVFRFVGIIGGRMDHGVIHDFVRKLERNPRELEILGDGSQHRSFVLVDDCIQAMLTSVAHLGDQVNIVHIGNREHISVAQVARLVCSALGLKDVRFVYTGGARGWTGDALTNYLECNSLSRIGWAPSLDSSGAAQEAARRLSTNVP
jgi:UDP-glucose 4-epimerase